MTCKARSAISRTAMAFIFLIVSFPSSALAEAEGLSKSEPATLGENAKPSKTHEKVLNPPLPKEQPSEKRETSDQTKGDEKLEPQSTSVSSRESTGPPTSPLLSEQGRTSKDGRPIFNNFTLTVLYNFALAIVGGVSAGLLIIWYNHRRRIMEYRSLLLGFSVELVLAFERCVTYYKQSITGGVSYSSIFDFTDASMVSRLAAVTDKPRIVRTIIELKSMYFQVRRHVEDASRFALEATRSEIKLKRASQEFDPKRQEVFTQEAKNLMDAAKQAQGTGIAFFTGTDVKHSTYQEFKDGIEFVIQTAKKKCGIRNKLVITDLEKEFNKLHYTKLAITNFVNARRKFSEEDLEKERDSLIEESKKRNA